MRKFIDIYHAALQNYIAQIERAHYTLAEDPDKRIFTFGLFSIFRHSKKEYPALLALHAQLESNSGDDPVMAIAAIQNHFADTNNKWNNHSFNNYLLDEIRKHRSEEEWDFHWKQYDKAPIVYYQGLLFRGAGLAPKYAFKDGILEEAYSRSIDSYINDCNGSTGVSTSKNFGIALAYALPQVFPNRPLEHIRSEAFVYVIDYQGSVGIDLEQTFIAREKNLSAQFSRNKAEVNIIGKIKPEDIVGAFHVNRRDKIIWEQNLNYRGKDLLEIFSELKDLIPESFFNRLSHHRVNKLI